MANANVKNENYTSKNLEDKRVLSERREIQICCLINLKIIRFSIRLNKKLINK